MSDGRTTPRFPRLVMAYRNLKRNRLRSVLAVLAVVIGVTAVGGMGLFGTTLQYSVSQSTADVGNEVVVHPPIEGPGIGGAMETLSRRQVRSIEEIADDTTTVAVLSKGDAIVEYRGSRQQRPLYAIARPGPLLEVVEGEVPSRLRSGALVSTTVADTLGIDPGNTIRVGDETYAVRGVFDLGRLPSLWSMSSSVVVPPAPGERGTYSSVVLLAENSRRSREISQEIASELNEREQQVTVSNETAVISTVSSIFTTIQTVLMGIASIALLVASVGILNIMLMSTIERREEIGVLRAVGFGKRDVLVVLLAEAVFLGVIGAAVGALVSVGVGMVVNEVMIGHPLRGFLPRSALYVVLAFAVGVFASLVGGLYPARKAANERPVEALEN